MQRTMDVEVARLLREKHTVAWMRDSLDGILEDLEKSKGDRDMTMNDVVSAFVCAMMREREYFRSEFTIGF